MTVTALQNTELDFLAVLPPPDPLHSLVRHAYPPYLTGFWHCRKQHTKCYLWNEVMKPNFILILYRWSLFIRPCFVEVSIHTSSWLVSILAKYVGLLVDTW